MVANKEKHDFAWDILRILACFFVIVNHTNSTIFLEGDALSITWITSNMLFNMCRMNVMTFVIISGALLLDKEESIKDWFYKRVLRIFLVIIFFSLLYYPLEDFSLFSYFKNIFTTHSTNAFWYLYMYLGLMLSLPILRPLCKNLDNNGFYLLFFFYIFKQGVMPLLEYYFKFPVVSSFFKIALMETYCWFPAMMFGYFLKHRISDTIYSLKGVKVSILSYIICIAIPTTITGYDFFVRKERVLIMDNPFLPWSLICTLCIIYIAIYIARHTNFINDNGRKLIKIMSAATFGTYLISDKLIMKTQGLYEYMKIVFGGQAMFAMILWIVVVFLIGIVFSTILKKIPLINQLL